MSTLIKSFIGIQTAQRELQKYPTEKEQQRIMEIIHSKAVAYSCRNMFYFIGAIILAGLIQWIIH